MRMEATMTMDAKPPEVPLRLLLTAKEAAAALGVCEKTLWSLTEPRGSIQCIRIGRAVRYDPRDLTMWIDNAKGN